ncbi:unnamed protein product [Brassica rapa]|uniref:CCDC22 coiled-coil domain-containing protein n=1 Tax=Brassica campestris TaxID=3711 RepID=A0A8D9G4L1_BRACM|nr:unnamed protein product [Brassica rapa]
MHENNTKNKHPRAPHDLSLPATLFLKPIQTFRFALYHLLDLVQNMWCEQWDHINSLHKKKILSQDLDIPYVRLTLEAKKLCLLDQLHVVEEPEAKEKFHKLKTTELDLQSLSSEIQKSDIQRISGETRELQLESNSIRERLHRSYAVVDEMVTRELKKDPAIRQVYKLVTSILMTDRLRREAVDYEKKLWRNYKPTSTDDIRQENQSLEKQLE